MISLLLVIILSSWETTATAQPLKKGRAAAGAAASTDSPLHFCSRGVLSGFTVKDHHLCCAAECGQCTRESVGRGCGKLPGLSVGCCARNILGTGRVCTNERDTGCLVTSKDTLIPPPPPPPPPPLSSRAESERRHDKDHPSVNHWVSFFTGRKKKGEFQKQGARLSDQSGRAPQPLPSQVPAPPPVGEVGSHCAAVSTEGVFLDPMHTIAVAAVASVAE